MLLHQTPSIENNHDLQIMCLQSLSSWIPHFVLYSIFRCLSSFLLFCCYCCCFLLFFRSPYFMLHFPISYSLIVCCCLFLAVAALFSCCYLLPLRHFSHQFHHQFNLYVHLISLLDFFLFLYCRSFVVFIKLFLLYWCFQPFLQ